MVDYIFSDEYIKIFVLASQYSLMRWDKNISEADIFFALIKVIWKNNTVKKMLQNIGFDLEKAKQMCIDTYKYKDSTVRKVKGSFVLSKPVISIIEQTKVYMDKYKDKKLFFVYMLQSMLIKEWTIQENLSNMGMNVKKTSNELDIIIEDLVKNKEKDLVANGLEDLQNVMEVINTTNEKIDKIQMDIKELEDMKVLLEEDIYGMGTNDVDQKDRWNNNLEGDGNNGWDNGDEDGLDDSNDKIKVKTPKKTWTKKLTIWLFASNLTQEARDGRLEPIIGRKKEIQQVIYTLLRKTKNNPLLIWEAGVGKTAIIEGLAQKIANGDVPEKLKDQNIYMLDMGTLVSWTKFRWEFESRLKGILEEASNPENNILLFIDEIHTIIGAGNAEGGADTANMLKPMLARGKISLIWATTWAEHRKHIEKDAALKRRFYEVVIDEPSKKDAKILLKGISHKFEDYHGVVISQTAIDTAVEQSIRYLLDRQLPDKAIDLLDEASVRKSVAENKVKDSKEYIKKKSEIKNLEIAMGNMVEEQDYFSAADLKEKIDILKRDMIDIKNKSNIPRDQRPIITDEDINFVLAERLGIPANNIQESEIEVLKTLSSDLKKKILWQDEAVEKIVSSIRRNKLSVIEKNKPIGSFLFLWPSGVGKTFLGQLLAKEYFKDENALIKIDMSEYMEKFNASKLIGSAPGYVGYDQWGVLTEAVRKKPYSVVLFDEIEKASPEVLNILLQILDSGYIKDNKGNKIDFKNTIIVLTSNIGSEIFAKDINSVWFSLAGADMKEGKFDEEKESVLESMKSLIPVELLNRFDYTVVFNPLTKDVLWDIFTVKYKEFAKLWKDKKWISIPKMTKAKLKKKIEELYKPESGARPIEKYIYNDLEDEIIENMLK